MFKVGDTVKIINKVWWIDRYFTNKIGIITNADRNSDFQYTISIDAYQVAVHGSEIEKVVTKGQQLLFSFMSEVI